MTIHKRGCQLMCEHTSNQQVTDACSFFYSLFIICINTTVNKAKFIVRETPNKYINISIKSINTTSILIVITMFFGGKPHLLIIISCDCYCTIFFYCCLSFLFNKFRQNKFKLSTFTIKSPTFYYIIFM